MIANGLRDSLHHERRNAVAEPLPLLRIAAGQDEIIREGANALQFSDGKFSPLFRVGARSVRPP